ncbi:transketolase family protein [Cetobacterium sp. 2A]|uniref:transketolase family protein n=1 Tax=Cetobacterium sp. 2A TaxID=2754723 RepID=UPI00163D32A1|nr:transketolase family protein [Cetobacterium sp. 2A]MBC2857268.1 transketolase family protein [Cetobacterium sp. 2A]
MDMKSTRDAFGEVLVEMGEKNEKIVALSADLQDSTKAIEFQKKFPTRFFNVGISEQDLIGIASGFADENFIPIVSSFASFLTTRPYDQIRILVCYNNLNVKIVATHTGLTVGEDGGTAQALEDIAIMRVLPNMKVFQPCDSNETKAIFKAVLEEKGPCYIRLARAMYPIIYSQEKSFKIGKSDILIEGTDITIFATGFMVSKALDVEKMLKKDGCSARVVNISSIKPIDRDLIIESALKTRAFVTIEEHQKSGGLGSAIAEVICEKNPIPIKIIGIEDEFGQSGTPSELIKEYGLDEQSIYLNIKNFIEDL